MEICSTSGGGCYSIDVLPQSDSLITISAPAMLADNYLISVETDAGESNREPLSVSAPAQPIYDTPPQITGVTPGGIPALSGQSVTINGSNLGSAGNLSICQGSLCLPYTIPSASWTDTEVNVVVDASAATPGSSYTVTLSTSADSLGNSYLAAPGAPADDATCASCNLEIDPASYSISGTAVAANGAPLTGIIITASSGASATTGANGSYTIGPFPACGNVSIGAAFLSPYRIPITADGPANGFFGYTSCIQTNQLQNFTANQYTAVYLLHGIGQSASDMFDLKSSLENGPNGLDLSKFYVDATFTYSECSQADPSIGACKSGGACTIANGAVKLATQYIANAPADIVFVGYSMGGLIARNLLVNGYTAAYGSVLNGRNVHGLITLSSPSLGYPFLAIDPSKQCGQLTLDMAGSWNPITGGRNPPMSSLLPSVNGSWGASSYGGYWLAAAGRFCTSSLRVQVGGGPPYTGCLEPAGVNSNDGVVCADSAQYADPTSAVPAGNPTATFNDPMTKYSHTNSYFGFGTALIMGCPTGSANPQIFDPKPGDSLYTQIVTVITNGH